MKFQKFFALLLTLAMVLPMVVSIIPANAEQSVVEELPTETQEVTVGGELTSKTVQWDFEDISQLEDFSLYHSGANEFSVQNGMLVPNGTDGEMKAVLNMDLKNLQEVSVDIIPGEIGLLNGGLYIGATDAADERDQICAQAFLIESNFVDWSDAPNRLDLVRGQFPAWVEHDRLITESGEGNALFSGGNKEPVNLKLSFEEGIVVATISLISDPATCVQKLFDMSGVELDGAVGLRALGSDLCYDNLKITYAEIANTQEGLWDFDDPSQLDDFVMYPEDSFFINESAQLQSQAGVNELILNREYSQNIKSISVDIHPVPVANTLVRVIGGIYLGGEEDAVVITAGGGRQNQWCELIRYTAKDHAITEVGSSSARPKHQTFFPEGDREAFNLKIEFGTNTLTATVTKLSDPSVKFSSTYEVDTSVYGKSIGLLTSNNSIIFDNLDIITTETVKWDFEDAAQFNDFAPYPAGTYSINASGQLESTAGTHEAVLNRSFSNVASVSVDIHPTASTSKRLIAGFCFVGEDNTVAITAGGGRTNSSNKAWCELIRYKGIDHTYTEVGSASSRPRHATFFPNGTRDAFNLRIDISADALTATVTKLSDPSVSFSSTYSVDMSVYGKSIGLITSSNTASFDNLEITTYTPRNTPGSTGIQYLNKGYDFFEGDDFAWILSKDVESTPYTVEAWVKVPSSVDSSKSAVIIGNGLRYPSVVLKMAANGHPLLVWSAENTDLSRKQYNFQADKVDLRTSQWTHIAYTCNIAADQVICYINGEVAAQWDNAGLMDISLPDSVMGQRNAFSVGRNFYPPNGQPDTQFIGWIADVRLWSKPLTGEEVQNSMMTQYTLPRDGLIFNAPLDKTVNSTFLDLSGNENHVTKYKRSFQLVDKEIEPGAYSIVVIPDQQILTRNFPEKLNQMYQWIADNREKENIQIVLNVGDLADSSGNTTQWERSKAAWELLPDNLPFIAAPGNHDYDTNSGWDKGYGVREQLTIMNQYFPMSLFENYHTEFGALSRDQGVEDNIANTWQAFEVNGNKYLVLALEYVPRTDALEWANEVVASHPDHQVIMITHSNMSLGGNPKSNIWSEFTSKHENIIMTVSGHVWNEYIVTRVDKGVNGNNVAQMLMDMQVPDGWSNGYGMLGILRFNADGTLCNVSYYSTGKQKYLNESNIFTLELPAQEHDCVAKSGMWSYETVAEAIEAANGGIVELLQSTDEAITVDTDVTIDLAGYTLSNVIVAEGVKLNLIDSTATYAKTKGSATVTGNVEKLVEHDGKKYMVIGENGVYAPHKYYVGITHVSLDTANTGFGYKAGFYGDTAVQAQIASIGYELWLTEDRVVTRTLDKFQNVVTLRLKNFLVEAYGEAPVNAKAVITLTDGTRLESAVNSYSMRSMIELLNDSAADFSVAKLQNVAMLIKKNSVMEAWNVANILAVLQPKANVEAITVTDQSMTQADGTTGTFTLNGACSFTAQDTEQTVAYSDYADWTADYYITMDKEAAEGLYLAGNYSSYGWIAIPVEAGKTYTNVPVVQTLLGTSLTYEEMVTQVVSFSCGVADTQSLNTGATVTAELRLTNPENPEEFIILNTTALIIA